MQYRNKTKKINKKSKVKKCNVSYGKTLKLRSTSNRITIKNNKYLIFKTKDMNSKRDTGARCDESGKKESIKILNEILGTEKYTTENTKGSHQKIFCIYQEMYLRYYTSIGKDGKVWYLNPIQAIINQI